MSVRIHPSSLVDPQAQIGEDVEIGPFCCIGPHVVLGDRVRLMSHVVITGRTSVGEDSIFFPFASIGHAPQDLKYAGEASTLSIGAHTRVREYVTIQPGTAGDRMTTQVGDHCLLMAGVHVAHDCVVGDHVVMANNVILGGHVVVGHHAIIGGVTGVHQFVRIGEYAIIGGASAVAGDVIPYAMAHGNRAELFGLNLVGLKRHQFDKQDLTALSTAYSSLFSNQSTTIQHRLKTLEPQLLACDPVQKVTTFIQAANGRPLCLPKKRLA